MVIDLKSERERRKLEARHNPSFTRDLVEVGIAYVVLAVAFTAVAWVILQQR